MVGRNSNQKFINLNPGIRNKLLILLIILIVFVAFLPSLFCDFTNWDDRWMLLDNPLVQKISLDHIVRSIFGKIYSGVYQPLVFLSFAVEYHFFGLNPLVYHLTNVLLHILISIFVYYFLLQLTKSKAASFVACLFWALNPLRVESVTWITERKDLLYALFYVLALIQYVHYLNAGNKRIHLLLSLLFFLLSCLSKLTAVSLPMIIVLLDYFYQRKLDLRSIAVKSVYFLISLTVGIFSIWAVKTDTPSGDGKVTTHFYSAFERFQLVSHSFLQYILKSVIPYKLSAWHPYVHLPGEIPAYYLFLSFITILIITVTLWYFYRFRRRKIIFGSLFFFAAVVFALQIFPVGDASFADRNIYISGVGVAFLAGELFLKSYNKLNKQITVSCCVMILMGYGYLTYQQTRVWNNSFTLWSDIISKYPDDPLGYYNRGAAKFINNKDYAGSIEDYLISLKRKPDSHGAMVNIAISLKHMKKFESALEWIGKSIKIFPGNPRAMFARGEIYYDKGDFEKAKDDFSLTLKHIRKDPFQTSLALTSRGRAKIAMQELDSALTDLNNAIELFPDNSDTWHFRGLCNYFKKKYKLAMDDFSKAMNINPGHDIAVYYLGLSHIAVGEISEGCENLKKAVNLSNPDASSMALYYCSDGNIKKTLFYPNGKLKFQIIRGGADTSARYHLCTFDSLGNLIQQGEFNPESGKYQGEIRWYYANGAVKKIGFSQDTTTYGSWKEFYQTGEVRAEYAFSNGVMDGIYRHYYPNGNLWTERYYRGGKLVSVLSCHDKNGKALDHGTFHNGNGSLNIYDENGEIIFTQNYKQGQFVSP